MHNRSSLTFHDDIRRTNKIQKEIIVMILFHLSYHFILYFNRWHEQIVWCCQAMKKLHNRDDMFCRWPCNQGDKLKTDCREFVVPQQSKPLFHLSWYLKPNWSYHWRIGNKFEVNRIIYNVSKIRLTTFYAHGMSC